MTHDFAPAEGEGICLEPWKPLRSSNRLPTTLSSKNPKSRVCISGLKVRKAGNRANPIWEMIRGSWRWVCSKNLATSRTANCRELGGRDGRGAAILKRQSSEITEARMDIHWDSSCGARTTPSESPKPMEGERDREFRPTERLLRRIKESLSLSLLLRWVWGALIGS